MENPNSSYIRLVSDYAPQPNRIRELREEMGLSQAELARRIPCSPPALQKVEIGARKLDQEWMRKIARVLGVPPAEILPRSDNPWMLSFDEKDLIERYRQSRAEDRRRLLRVADAVFDFEHDGPVSHDNSKGKAA